MQRLVKYSTAVTATGTYAALNATPGTYVAPVGNQVNVPALLASATFIAFGNAGVSGGAVQPFALGPNGIYYPLATATTVAAPGFILTFQLTSPVPGVALQITTTVTGGTLDLVCIGIMI